MYEMFAAAKKYEEKHVQDPCIVCSNCQSTLSSGLFFSDLFTIMLKDIADNKKNTFDILNTYLKKEVAFLNKQDEQGLKELTCEAARETQYHCRKCEKIEWVVSLPEQAQEKKNEKKDA